MSDKTNWQDKYDDAIGALARLSSWLGTGFGSRVSTPDWYEERIRVGVDLISAPLVKERDALRAEVEALTPKWTDKVPTAHLSKVPASVAGVWQETVKGGEIGKLWFAYEGKWMGPFAPPEGE